MNNVTTPSVLVTMITSPPGTTISPPDDTSQSLSIYMVYACLSMLFVVSLVLMLLFRIRLKRALSSAGEPEDNAKDILQASNNTSPLVSVEEGHHPAEYINDAMSVQDLPVKPKPTYNFRSRTPGFNDAMYAQDLPVKSNPAGNFQSRVPIFNHATPVQDFPARLSPGNFPSRTPNVNGPCSHQLRSLAERQPEFQRTDVESIYTELIFPPPTVASNHKTQSTESLYADVTLSEVPRGQNPLRNHTEFRQERQTTESIYADVAPPENRSEQSETERIYENVNSSVHSNRRNLNWRDTESIYTDVAPPSQSDNRRPNREAVESMYADIAPPCPTEPKCSNR